MGKKTFAVVEFGDIVVRVACGEKRGKEIVVDRLFSREAKDPSAAIDVLFQERFSYDELYIVLSRNLVTVRHLSLPTTDAQEIAGILAMQIERLTPFQRDDVIYDFQIVPSPEKHYGNIILAITPKKSIRQYLEWAMEKVEALQRISLSSECTGGLYRLLFRGKVADKTFFVLEFHREFCDCCVLKDGALIFTRLMPIGTDHLVGDGWQESFARELQISINSYDGENIGPAVKAVVLINPSTAGVKIAKVLQEQFSLDVVAPAVGMTDVFYGEGLRLTCKQGCERDPLLLKLVSLVMKPDELSINLLPEKITEVRLMYKRRKGWLKTVMLAAVAAALGVGLIAMNIIIKERAYAKIDKKLTTMNNEGAFLKKKIEKLKVIKKQVNAADSAVEALYEIHRSIPSDIYLVEIVYDGARSISARGTGSDVSSVFKYVKTLEQTTRFKDIKTKYVSKRKDRVDFDLSFTLSPEK